MNKIGQRVARELARLGLMGGLVFLSLCWYLYLSADARIRTRSISNPVLALWACEAWWIVAIGGMLSIWFAWIMAGDLLDGGDRESRQ